MKIGRFQKLSERQAQTGPGITTGARIGVVVQENAVMDLTPAGIIRMADLLEKPQLVDFLQELALRNLPVLAEPEFRWLAPIDQQEVWAAGVTYLRSKKARMEESNFSAQAYDRVYEADRPELFFKSLPEKVSGPGDPVGIRKDSRWNVPEPELTLVINSRGQIAGYTLGNDMSSREIEGENLLYLPQAKIYRHSCALGPAIVIGATEDEVRTWQIEISIQRGAQVVFSGSVSVSQIKRRFQELADYLFRSQEFPHGTMLLTGTGIVPQNDFTLQPGDRVEIRLPQIGMLANPVVGV